MNINLTAGDAGGGVRRLIWFHGQFIWPPLMGAIADAPEADRRRPGRRRAGSPRDRQHPRAHCRHADRGEAKSAEIVATGEKSRPRPIEAAKGEAKPRPTASSPRGARRSSRSRAGQGAAAQPGADLAVAGAVAHPRREVDAKAHADLLASLRAEI
jgi:F-type H+-transporting ATPase subunit b